MKTYSEEFKTELYQTIENIEENSQVEIVAMIKNNSGNYRDISFFAGAVILFLAYTYFMFAPTVFDVYLIYFLTIVAFMVGYSLVEFIPPVQRFLIRNRRKEKNVELYSRASFQKGGLRHTTKEIAVLIYVSIFERKVKIIADRGVKTMIPKEEWETITSDFETVFSVSNFQEAFLEKLKRSEAVFSKYIPPVEDDINELPDDLDIEI